MSRIRVKKGDSFLPGTALPELIMAYKKEPPGKSRDRLQAAVMRKRDKSQAYIARHLGRAQSVISDWLHRIHDEGIGNLHDRKSPGRPCRLSAEQQDKVKAELQRPPSECGFERGTWTASGVAQLIEKLFGILYGPAGALALAHRLGFSVRKSRPVHHKTVTPEEEFLYVTKTVKAIIQHTDDDYVTVCVDASAMQNGSYNGRGLRLAGTKNDTVRVNFSKESLKVIGAIGDGICHLHFCDSADSENLIAVLEELRRHHGKVFVILDNASAHRSKKVREYLESTHGRVVLWYLPPYTPQHNPIEMLWRELKRALAGRYYAGGFDQMRWSIIRMVSGGEVAVVKLLAYMRYATARGKQGNPLPAA